MVHPTTFDQWCGEWGAGSFSLPQFWLRLLQLSAKRFHQAGPPMPKSPRELEELREELLTGMNSNRSCEGTESERLHRTKVFTLCKKGYSPLRIPKCCLLSSFLFLPPPITPFIFPLSFPLSFLPIFISYLLFPLTNDTRMEPKIHFCISSTL